MKSKPNLSQTKLDSLAKLAEEERAKLKADEAEIKATIKTAQMQVDKTLHKVTR